MTPVSRYDILLAFVVVEFCLDAPVHPSLIEMSPGQRTVSEYWCFLCFVLLRFRLYAFVEAAALRSIVLRYAGAPIATRVSFFPFVYLDMSLFPSIFCTIAAFSLYGEYVVRSFLPNDVFLPCDHGLDF